MPILRCDNKWINTDYITDIEDDGSTLYVYLAIQDHGWGIGGTGLTTRRVELVGSGRQRLVHWLGGMNGLSIV